MKIQLQILTLAAFVTLAGCATADSEHDHAGHKHASAAKGKPYPLKTCMVTDEDLDKDAYVFVYKGQQIKLCCEPCKEDFDKDPAKYLKKLAGK